MSQAGEPSHLVAGCHPWNREVFDRTIRGYPGRWHYVGSPEELTLEAVERLDPRYLFFLHWSWKVRSELVDAYECVAFHMTDLPYGRGGSPLQNLIRRGHRTTRLSAFRMTHDIDAGPIYMKESLALDGRAQEIYVRATELAARMIERIIREHPTPEPQEGEVVRFKRRKPAESAIPESGSARELFDFIRMLDSEGYPRAFIEHGGFRYEFGSARLDGERVSAEVTVTPRAEADGGEA